MSLKAFHVFFIVCSVLLTLGFGVWGIVGFASSGNVADAVMGGTSIVGAVVLVVYGIAFLKKLKHVGLM
jgi:uncharacterized membrane protein YuzA (DUF378 family)